MNCKYCKKSFIVSQSDIKCGSHKGIYCSQICYLEEVKSTSVTLVCAECGKQYKVVKSRENKSKYCSRKCKSGRVNTQCHFCYKQISVKRAYFIKTGNYCSRICADKGRSQKWLSDPKSHPNWKGGSGILQCK